MLKPEVARLDFVFLGSIFEIVSAEADLGKENIKGYSTKLKWFRLSLMPILCGVFLGGWFERIRTAPLFVQSNDEATNLPENVENGPGAIAAAKMRSRMDWSSNILKNDLIPARKSLLRMNLQFSFILQGLGERMWLVAISGFCSIILFDSFDDEILKGDLKYRAPRSKRNLSSWKEISRSEIEKRLEFLKGNLAFRDQKVAWVLERRSRDPRILN